MKLWNWMKMGNALLAGIVLFTGCSKLQELLLKASLTEEEMMRNYFEAAMDALEQGDAEAFQALFSEEAKTETDGKLQEETEALLEFYQAKMQSYDLEMGSTSEHLGGGDTVREYYATVTITTDGKPYEAVLNVKQAKEDDSKIGISLFDLMEIELDNYEPIYWITMPEFGAFCEDETKSQLEPLDYIYSLERWVETPDTERLQAVFVPEVQKQSEFEMQVTQLEDWFRGYVQNWKGIVQKTFQEMEVTVQETDGITYTEGLYEFSTYDTFGEYGDLNAFLCTYQMYFKHRRDPAHPETDGFVTVQVVEKTEETLDWTPLEQNGIWFGTSLEEA